MQKKYIDLIYAFRDLNIDDKRKEIKSNLVELLKLLSSANKDYDYFNEVLPIYTSSDTDDEEEYLNEVFSLIISLKEENAKLVGSVLNLKD